MLFRNLQSALVPFLYFAVFYMSHALHCIACASMSISKNVNGSFSDAEILEVRSTYYAMVAETDYMLGLVLQVKSFL